MPPEVFKPGKFLQFRELSMRHEKVSYITEDGLIMYDAPTTTYFANVHTVRRLDNGALIVEEGERYAPLDH